MLLFAWKRKDKRKNGCPLPAASKIYNLVFDKAVSF